VNKPRPPRTRRMVKLMRLTSRLDGCRSAGRFPGALWLSSSLHFGMSRLELDISGIHGCRSDCVCAEGERVNGLNLCRLELSRARIDFLSFFISSGDRGQSQRLRTNSTAEESASTAHTTFSPRWPRCRSSKATGSEAP